MPNQWNLIIDKINSNLNRWKWKVKKVSAVFIGYVDCQPLNSKRPLDLPVKKKRHRNIFSIRTTNPPIDTDFFPKGQGVISKGLMPCRYTKSPWYVYMKAKTRFVESMRLVNTFRVFKFTTQSVNEIWKILSTLFVLNHWSDKKVDLWGLWGGGGGWSGVHTSLPTPLPTGLYSCPASDNVMSFWIKFVMIC